MKTDNELIAEFMEVPDSAVPYDTSWDWLKPVIDKIGALRIEYDINKTDKDYEINRMANRLVCNLPITYDLDRVYDGVVEFIKWHNSQKEPS